MSHATVPTWYRTGTAVQAPLQEEEEESSRLMIGIYLID
jgi:hypothetical protein